MTLEHVVRVGGGIGAGKTTVARALAVRHGLRAFLVDAFWYAHDARLGEPELSADERRLLPTPAEARAFEERSRRALELDGEDGGTARSGERGDRVGVEPILHEPVPQRLLGVRRRHRPRLEHRRWNSGVGTRNAARAPSGSGMRDVYGEVERALDAAAGLRRRPRGGTPSGERGGGGRRPRVARVEARSAVRAPRH